MEIDYILFGKKFGQLANIFKKDLPAQLFLDFQNSLNIRKSSIRTQIEGQYQTGHYLFTLYNIWVHI